MDKKRRWFKVFGIIYFFNNILSLDLHQLRIEIKTRQNYTIIWVLQNMKLLKLSNVLTIKKNICFEER